VLAKLNEVRTKTVRDPGNIDKNIDNLVGPNERMRLEATNRLIQAGEVAVPQMVNRLRDTKYQTQHAAILKVLRQMGSAAINPLLAVTESHEELLLIQVSRLLLEMNFTADVLPYIARAVEDPKTQQVTRGRLVAVLAMAQQPVKELKAGDLFYNLAERFYYNTSAVRPDVREANARVWSWSDGSGLSFKECPREIFSDIMAIRSAETALRYNTTKDATSLWLSANNKRAVDFGANPPTGPYADLDPHYWNVRLGARYLNEVLRRAMNDGDAQGILSTAQRSTHTMIAMRAIKSLAEIVGQSNMEGTQLLDAMRYSDRQVRYEAALAIAGGLPQRPFPGQERVVLLLAEALAQTGTSGVLIFANTPAEVTAAATALKDKYKTAGGTSAAQVIAESAQLPSIDAMLISEDVNPQELTRLFATASESPRLDRAARIIMVKASSSSWFRSGATDTRLSATLATPGTPAELAKSIEEGKTRAGGIPLDEKGATEYALRAAGVLEKLAISRGQVLDISVAEPTLLAGLLDARPELAKAAARVVALLDSQRSQTALCDRAIEEKTPDDVKVSMYKGLASSAKFFGNRLDSPRIDNLRKATTAEKAPEVKAAAAEALGALNLNVEQVKPLILDRPGNAPPIAAAP